MQDAKILTPTQGAEPPSSLQERIYLLLKEMIAEGRIKAGERLLEAEVVRAFGISRSPARQALNRLCQDGLVEELPGRGYRVAGTANGEGAGLAVQFDRAESDMHIDLLGYCPNEEILRALRRTHLLFGPTRYLFDPFLGIPMELIEAALKEHQDIVEFVLAGKTGKAALALRAHLQDAVDRWLRRFEITTRMTPQRLPPYLASI